MVKKYAAKKIKKLVKKVKGKVTGKKKPKIKKKIKKTTETKVTTGINKPSLKQGAAITGGAGVGAAGLLAASGDNKTIKRKNLK
tara:strand:- start:579 stop:830 length:252 start_codon:yes stop_codon:yes gene_type:complete